MIDTSLKDVERYKRELAVFSKRAWPYANRGALNGMAFAGQKAYRAEIEDKLTLRNRWTLGSVKVKRAQGTNVSRQMSVVGSVAPYMETQEFGGVQRGKGRTGKPIATPQAAGQARGAIRTRLPRRKNQLSQIRLGGKVVRPRTPKQRLVLLARQAVETGRRQIYLDGQSGPRRGIYEVRRGSLRNKRGWPRGAKLEMLWDLSRKTVTTPATPLLGPATRAVQQRGPQIYVEAIQYQIKQQQLFRSRRGVR